MSPVMVGMGTTDKWEEPTQPEPFLSMAQVVEQGEAYKAIDDMLELLGEPTEPGDGFPFLADGTRHMLRFPAWK